jgi:hypothetical protein
MLVPMPGESGIGQLGTQGVSATQVSTPRLDPITPAASGANIGEAVTGLGQTVEKAGGEAAQAWMMKARMTQEADAFDRVSKLSAVSDKILYNTDPDPVTGKPLGIALRKGADAANSDMLGDYQKAMQKATGDIMAGASPYAASMASHYSQFTTRGAMSSLSSHKATQFEEWQKDSTQGAIHGIAQNTLTGLPTKKSNETQKQYEDRTEKYISEGMALAEATAMQYAKNIKGAGGNPLKDANGNQILGQDGKPVKDNDVYKEQAAYHVMSTVLHPGGLIDSNPRVALQIASNDAIMSHLNGQDRQALQATVHGKMMDVEANTALSGVGDDGKNLQISYNKDGSPILDSAKAYINTLSHYTPEEQEKIYQLYETKNNDAQHVLDVSNRASSMAFASQVSEQNQDGSFKMGLNDANKLAHSTADKFRNGDVDNDDIRAKLKYIAALHAPSKDDLNPETYSNLLSSVNSGSITKIDPIVEAHDAGEISTGAMNGLIKQLSLGRTDAMKRVWSDMEKNLPDSIPNPTDQNEFKATTNLQWVEIIKKHPELANDPQAAKDLWNKNLESSPTGVRNLFGFMKEKENWKQAQAAQKLVAGNTEEVMGAMQRLGIPNPDSEQGKALSELIKARIAPSRITNESIAAAMKQLSGK